MSNGKPLIEVFIVSTDGESMTKTTFDFDMVMGVSPFTHKMRNAEGKFQPVMGSMLMLKNNREIFVNNEYSTLCDQWINLTHACVLNDEFTGTCKCGEKYTIRNRKP